MVRHKYACANMHARRTIEKPETVAVLILWYTALMVHSLDAPFQASSACAWDLK